MDSDWKDIFPCWGEHSRMGHKVVYGHFSPGPGETVICRIPAQEEDDDNEATPADTLVLPMGGPAFYGFRLLDEAKVLTLLRDRRPRKYKPYTRQIGVSDQNECPQCGILKNAQLPYCSTECMEAAEGHADEEVIDGQEQGQGAEDDVEDDDPDAELPYKDDDIPF